MKYRINSGVFLKFQYTTQTKLDITSGFSEVDQINYYFMQKRFFYLIGHTKFFSFSITLNTNMLWRNSRCLTQWVTQWQLIGSLCVQRPPKHEFARHTERWESSSFICYVCLYININGRVLQKYDTQYHDVFTTIYFNCLRFRTTSSF